MKIVIDIPEYLYKEIVNDEEYGIERVRKAVINGTPLQKNHGRLIDADMLKEYARVVEDAELGRLHTVDVKDIDNAPTVIEENEETE